AEEPGELAAQAAEPVEEIPAPDIEQAAHADHEPELFEPAAIIEEAAPLPLSEISVVEPIVVAVETRHEEERPFIVAESAVERAIAGTPQLEEPAAEEPVAEVPMAEMAVAEA